LESDLNVENSLAHAGKTKLIQSITDIGQNSTLLIESKGRRFTLGALHPALDNPAMDQGTLIQFVLWSPGNIAQQFTLRVVQGLRGDFEQEPSLRESA
jgi:hypothetical protein